MDPHSRFAFKSGSGIAFFPRHNPGYALVWMEPVLMGTVLESLTSGSSILLKKRDPLLSHDRSRFHARDKDWDQRGRLN